MAQRACRPELINCKRQKYRKYKQIHKIQNNNKKSNKQKQKTPTKCKSKSLTVEWHKEAADQISENCKIENTENTNMQKT